MTISAENSDVQEAATADVLYYDPYSVELNMNPYPVFARIREEAPLYYNDKHDFYALSRFDDVNKAKVEVLADAGFRGRDRYALERAPG